MAVICDADIVVSVIGEAGTASCGAAAVAVATGPAAALAALGVAAPPAAVSSVAAASARRVGRYQTVCCQASPEQGVGKDAAVVPAGRDHPQAGRARRGTVVATVHDISAGVRACSEDAGGVVCRHQRVAVRPPSDAFGCREGILPVLKGRSAGSEFPPPGGSAGPGGFDRPRSGMPALGARGAAS